MTASESFRNRARPRWAAVAGMALLATALLAHPAAAQDGVSSPQVTGIELTGRTQQTLEQIKEQWLQWLSAYIQNDRERADSVVGSLVATADQLQMQHLPDLAFGVLVRAVEAAQEGDYERAEWALAAAERLDPGRPEVAFAGARVAGRRGAYMTALGEYARGYARLFSQPVERRLWFFNLGLGTLYALLIGGGLFITVQMAVKGGGLYRDVVRFLERLMPSALAHVAAVALLVWPLLLPVGWLWLLLYWSVMLWGYGSPSERGVLIAIWLLAGVAPIAVAEVRGRVALDLSPPMKAIESLDRGRLYGALFTDLGALRSMLPDSPAVKHLLADVHFLLGQWDQAGALYRQILEMEPESPSVLVNLGAYYYYKESGSPIGYFRRATEADPDNAAAFFNLSKALLGTVTYFDEGQAARARAREIDDAQVSRWIKEDQILTFKGGFSRLPEIRGELASLLTGSEVRGSRVELLRRGLTLVVALGLVAMAFTLHLSRRAYGYTAPPVDLRLSRGLPERLLRVLLPGFASAEDGSGLRSYLALLVPVVLLLLPLGGSLLFRIPWGYDPGVAIPWVVALFGLAAFLAVRLVGELRRGI